LFELGKPIKAGSMGPLSVKADGMGGKFTFATSYCTMRRALPPGVIANPVNM